VRPRVAAAARRLLVAVSLVLVGAAGWFVLRSHDRLVSPRLGEPLRGPALPPEAPPSPAAPSRVWIETDAGCGLGRHVDVDDCFALVMALAAPELDVRGIGTVAGNVELAEADSVTRELVGCFHRAPRPPQVWRGALASRALAAELERGPLTILALGPLTNVAAALQARPELAGRVAELVLVGGRRPGQWMHPGYDHLVTFSDFNVATDPAAAGAILRAAVPLTLVPFEAALATTLSAAELDLIARRGEAGAWLRARSGQWLGFWRDQIGRDGFVPFDNAAVMYLLRPALLECVAGYGRLERSLPLPWFGIGRPRELMVASEPGLGRAVRYCGRTRDGFDAALMERLGTAAGMGAPRRSEVPGAIAFDRCPVGGR
jgi:purine nucleosidase